MVMWFFAPGAPCGGYGRKPMRKSIAGFSSRSEARHGRCSARTKKRRKPDTGQNAAARCFLTNLKLLT